MTTQATHEIPATPFVQVPEDPQVGDLVGCDGTIWTIEAISRGWFTLTSDEGTRKARKAQLTEVSLEPEQEDEDDEPKSTMARTLAKYRGGYLKTTNVTGRKTQVCGDWLSQELTSLFPHEVALLADRVFDERDGFHLTRYAHLNDGQVRMNSGNRIRAKFRGLEGDEAQELLEFVEAAIKAIQQNRKAD